LDAETTINNENEDEFTKKELIQHGITKSNSLLFGLDKTSKVEYILKKNTLKPYLPDTASDMESRIFAFLN